MAITSRFCSNIVARNLRLVQTQLVVLIKLGCLQKKIPCAQPQMMGCLHKIPCAQPQMTRWWMVFLNCYKTRYEVWGLFDVFAHLRSTVALANIL